MNSAETFDGAEEVRRAWMAGLAPDPSLTVSQWADRHRVLSSRAASEAGAYRTARTPYMKAVMDALPPRHPAQRVVFMKAAQVGATEACNNWIGFCMHRALGPFLAAQPTVDLAKRLSQQRIDPLIEESPDLRALVVPSRSWDAGNTILGTFHHLSSPSSQCQNGRPDGPTIKAKSFADCIRSSGDTCISARGSGRKRRSIRCRKALRCGCW